MEIDNIHNTTKELLSNSEPDSMAILPLPYRPSPQPEPLTLKRIRDHLAPYSVRIKMCILLAIVALIMVANHKVFVFFEDLSHHQDFNEGVGATLAIFDPDEVQKYLQKVTSIVGNLFASVANLMLSAVVGMAFIQIFWKRMRSRVHTIAEIDSAMNCAAHPFSPSARKSWTSMFWLSAIPALGFANMQIVLFASGSIQAEQALVADNCTVFTVDLSNSSLVGTGAVTTNSSSIQQQQNFNFTNPKAQVQGFVTQVIMFDEVLPPYIVSIDVDSYNVTFNAPALKCFDFSGVINASDILPLPSSSQNATIPIWNTMYSVPTTPASNLTFITATRNLALASDGETVVPDETQQQIVQCVFYNTTYNVTVKLGQSGFDAFVRHNETVFNAPLTVGSPSDDSVASNNFLTIANTFANTLNGTAAFDPVSSDFTPGSPIIVFSLFGEQEAGVPWSLGPDADLSKSMQELMDFVSVSLLSNFLNTGSGTSKSSSSSSSSSKSKQNMPLLSEITAPCQIEVVAFQYDRLRLLLSYGAGIFYSSLCALAGFLAIKANGVEESMDLSRLLKAMVNKHLLDHQERLNDDETLLRAGEGEKGEFSVHSPPGIMA